MRPLLLAVVLMPLAFGCGTSGTTGNVSTDKTPGPEPTKGSKMVTAAWPTDIKIHRNAKGEVVCGVLQDVIASPDKAVGFQDYKGVRYYFCCNGCPEQFKENPEKFAEKPAATPKTGQ